MAVPDTQSNETEWIHHTTIRGLEGFIVDITSREPHGHGDLEVGILLEGRIDIHTEGTILSLDTGDIYIMNRYQVHSFSTLSPGNRILIFQIHPDLYSRISPELSRIQFTENILRSGPLYEHIRRDLFDCAFAYYSSSPYKELKCSSSVLDLLFALVSEGEYTESSTKEYQTARSASRRITQITDYISEHFADRLSLEDMAAREEVSVTYLSHFIHKALGMTFQDYINSVRFERALYLVGSTDLNLLDICVETGFSSTRYLNQAFRKAFGIGAREYRQMASKPTLPKAILPAGNVQTRFSYEQSAAYLDSIISQ